jgi:hypothetical protein
MFIVALFAAALVSSFAGVACALIADTCAILIGIFRCATYNWCHSRWNAALLAS